MLAKLYRDGEGVTRSDEAAAKWVRQAAEQGVLEAQLEAARICQEGRGVPTNLAEAIRWYRAASEQGDVESLLQMANLFKEGPTADPTEAAECLRLAVEHGHAGAKLALARMLIKGDGVKKDVREALRLYRQAGDAGQADGYVEIAKLCLPEMM